MNTTLSQRLRRTPLVKALLGIALGILAIAGTLILAQSVSAQSVATPLQVSQNYPAPTFTLHPDEEGVHIRWNYDHNNTPPGWRLQGFDISRFVEGNSASNWLFRPASDRYTRYLLDDWRGTRLQQWNSGTEFSYAINATYERKSEGKSQDGKEGTVKLVAVQTPREVAATASNRPKVSVKADSNGVNLSWRFDEDTQTPPGWKLSGFVLRRSVQGKLGTLHLFEPSFAASKRSFTDPWSNARRKQWVSGTNFTYAMTTLFQRLSDTSQQIENRDVNAVLTHPATPLEVVQDAAAVPQLSSEAHADGVNLSWTFNEASMTPDGWRLGGFSIRRSIEGVRGSLTYVASRLPTTDRSFKDPLTGTSEGQRLPGEKFSYQMNAFFHRIADGAEQVGGSSKAHVFTAPTMPKPLNFKIGYRPGTRLSTVLPRSLLLSWERPHLSWDASTGFTGIDQYHFYRGSNGYEDGSHWLSITGQYTSHTWNTQWYCQGPFQLLAQYGLFYSDLVTSSEGREDC